MNKSVLITGSNGGIGREICIRFLDMGWDVFATDIDPEPAVEVSSYFSVDLNRLCIDESYRSSVLFGLPKGISGGLDCLINNAAYQYISTIENIGLDAWQKSLNVNVTAPFLLVKALLEPLRAHRGCVINISSIHSKLTKSGFIAYAASKTAIEGLTRALAVELGKSVRVNGVSPAAIDTSMLRSGFVNNSTGWSELASCHPTNCLGQAEDVAVLVSLIAQYDLRFLNGSIVGMDGGIASRLHDPG